jgi:hypothetical protein
VTLQRIAQRQLEHFGRQHHHCAPHTQRQPRPCCGSNGQMLLLLDQLSLIYTKEMLDLTTRMMTITTKMNYPKMKMNLRAMKYNII